MENASPLDLELPSLPYIGQFFERFSFWGLQSVLVLFLIARLNITTSSVFIMYGLFTFCAFILAYFGGFIADKLLGFRNAITLGISLECLGNLLLYLNYSSLTYIGLALIAIGAGFFTANNPYLVTNINQTYHLKKWNNMSLLYVCENTGFIFGLVIYGLISNVFGIKYCFLLSFCSLASYLVFLFYLHKLKLFSRYNQNSISIKNILITTVIILSTVFLISIILKFSKYSNPIIAILASIIIVTFIKTIHHTVFKDKSSLLKLFIIYTICLIFFTVLFQMNSSIQMFIQDHVQRKVFNWNIPASSFAALESLFAIICAPILSFIWLQLDKRKTSVSDTSKVALGLFSQTIGFYIFIQAMHLALIKAAGISPLIIIPGYLFLGAGDICIMATVLTTITTLTPDHLKGTMMGSFYVLIGFSGYLAGNLAGLTAHNLTNPLLATINIFKNINYLALFISIFTLLICILLQRRSTTYEAT